MCVSVCVCVYVQVCECTCMYLCVSACLYLSMRLCVVAVVGVGGVVRRGDWLDGWMLIKNLVLWRLCLPASVGSGGGSSGQVAADEINITQAETQPGISTSVNVSSIFTHQEHRTTYTKNEPQTTRTHTKCSCVCVFF